MGRRRGVEDEFEDDHNLSDDDDPILGTLKPTAKEGQRLHTDNGKESHFPVPTRLYSYDYITGPWMRHIIYRGIGDARAKAFLSELTLVNGSIHGGVETRWSQGHEFWEAEIQSTGQKDIFFSSDSIDELVNILAEQVDQVPKANLKPDKSRSVSVKSAIDRSTLRAFRPVDSEELRAALTEHKGAFFSLLLTQSRAAYQKVQNEGGTVFTLRSQRLDIDPRITIEVGWSYLRQVFDNTHNFTVKEEVVRHRVIDEFRQHRNGAKVPDTQNDFGFPDPDTREGTLFKPESTIMSEIQTIISQICCTGPVLLVVHDAETELSFFRSHPGLSREMDKWMADVPSNLYQRDANGRFPVVLQDCRPLYASYRQNPEYASTILASACKFEGIKTYKMNNAGNDSYYLLQLFDHVMTAPTGYTL